MTRCSGPCAFIAVVVGVLACSAPAIRLFGNPPATLQMPESVGSLSFRLTNAFSVPVTNPLAISTPPGETNRLFIVERAGRIVVITNLAAPTRSVFLDITNNVSGLLFEGGLLGLAFHPGYATNRQFYIFYTSGTNQGGSFFLLDRLSQMRASATDPNTADASSEVILLNQLDRSGNHNGGDIHFGPDGYLHVALGDEGGANDELQNSQRIDKNFFSGLLRIDVDNRPGSLMPNPHPANTNNATGTIHYRIPPDNPWVGATNFNGVPVDPADVRTEFYAVGLRNPWRFSFDPETGALYCGDVGQNGFEEINVIRRGGNFGWNYREGYHAGPRSNPPVQGTFDEPITEYGRSLGVSVTGGVVYRGNRAPAFRGAYVFADYSFGYIWGLWPDGINAVTPFQIAQQRSIVGFGVDPRNGDVLAANIVSNRLQRLIVEEQGGSDLPPTLFYTGAFTNLTSLTSHTDPLTPNVGLHRYEINVPSWADGAMRTHWFFRPSTNFMIGFSPTNRWFVPDGSAWVQHFDLQLTNGVPSSARRLETRLLVRNDSQLYGVTYRWGDSLTSATLVPASGLNESFIVHDGDTVRTQVWRYPARADCIRCHRSNGPAGISFETVQLNRDVDFGNGSTNQLAAWSQAGFFSAPITNLNLLRSLAAATNESSSREWRVRSYLQANCIHCHRGFETNGFWTALSHVRLSASGLIRGSLRHDAGGDTNNRVVVPGSLDRSMLLSRISRQDRSKMPPLGTSMLDTQGIALVSAWITNDLASYETFAEWQTEHFGSSSATNGRPDVDADFDGAPNLLEWLTRTDPNVNSDVWKIGAQANAHAVQLQVPQVANRGFEVQRTSLLNPAIWQPLDSPANRPYFSPTNRLMIVEDALTNAASFYRVRVFEP